MALQGTLTDFGIGEIFQLVGQQQKTGILIVEDGPDDTAKVELYFLGGKILQCQAARRDKRDLLGTMLVAAEAITQAQLNQGLKQQKRTGKRIGETLVEQGVLDQEALDEFTDLQTRETLYKLFEWKTGKYRFDSKPATFAEPGRRTMTAETLLMEGFRMLDEWPLIRAEINNYNVVYKPLRTIEDAESEAEALERVLDDAFSEFMDDEPDEDKPKKKGPTGAASNLGRSERSLFKLIDRKRTVYKLIAMSRLGEFETCKALHTLISEGYIAPVKVKAPSTHPGLGRMSARGVAARVAFNVLLVAAIALLFVTMQGSRAKLDRDAAQVARQALSRLRANRVIAVAGALEVYRIEQGSYPAELNELIKKGFVNAKLLDLPGQPPLDYLSISSDFDLR